MAKKQPSKLRITRLVLVLVCLVFFCLNTSVLAWPDLDTISAKAYLVYDLTDDKILMEQNAETIVYPASITKIMTAIVVMDQENFDPAAKLTTSEAAITLPSPEAVRLGLVAGEELVLKDALHALLIASANDVANALAEHFAGSNADFVQLMNQKAVELGMHQTKYLDPSGFGGEEHYTTANDMIKLIKYAYEKPFFREIVSKRSYIMPATNIHNFKGWAYLNNTNQLLFYGPQAFELDRVKKFTGLKTGTTGQAGYCLISSFTTFNDHEIACLVFDGNISYNYDNNEYNPVALVQRYLIAKTLDYLDYPTTLEAEASSNTSTTSSTSPSSASVSPETKILIQTKKIKSEISLSYIYTILVLFTLLLILFTILLIKYYRARNLERDVQAEQEKRR